jgi:CBS domain-containing protein
MSTTSKGLSEMTAADVMASSVVYVAVETPLKEIANVLLRQAISAVPVLDQAGRVVGMVSEGDLVRRDPRDQRDRRSWWLDLFEARDHSEALLAYLQHHGLRAKDVMTSDVISVHEDTPITEVAKLLEAHRIKRVPVLRNGRAIGIVSRADLLLALSQTAPLQRHQGRSRRKL